MATDDLSDDFAGALQDLIQAAARFGLAAGQEYRKRDAEGWQRFVKLFNTGAGELTATVQLSPVQNVALALVIAGERHVFFETKARPIGGLGTELMSQAKH